MMFAKVGAIALSIVWLTAIVSAWANFISRLFRHSEMGFLAAWAMLMMAFLAVAIALAPLLWFLTR